MSLPSYSVYIIANNAKYNVTGALLGLTLNEDKSQIAQTANIKIANVVHNGSYLTSLFDVIDRISIFATYEGKTEEVFRGFTWEKDYTSSTDKTLSLVCYDNLIYLQKSEICEYFPEGSSTDTICSTLCDKWGINLKYQYRSIKHPKSPLDGLLGDSLIEILDKVKKQTGAKYVLRSAEDTMFIKEVGTNSTIYEVVTKKNAGSVRYKKTMDDVVTQVVITGKKGDDDRTPIEATVKGKTNEYGTLQRIISKDEDTALSEAKAEAQELIDENGTPTETIHLTDAVDIPFLHKGDMIKVTAGNIVGKYCIVLNIEHDASKKTMDLICEFAETKTTAENNSSKEESSGAAGKQLSLSGVPLYISATASNKSTTVSGTYYLYDGIEKSGRYRITNSSNRVGKKPVGNNVTGWIDKEYV